MIQLQPEYELDVIPYASTIIFELYKKGKTFNVRSLFNSKELFFDTCNNQAFCPFSEWLSHINDRLVTDLPTLKSQCNTNATSDDYNNDKENDWHYNQTIKEVADKTGLENNGNVIELEMMFLG